MIRKIKLNKPCRICGEYFRPTGCASKTCEICIKKILKKRIENGRNKCI